MSRPATDGVIFDLDDTLFDCSGQLTAPARRRAAAVLAREAATLSEAEAFRLQTEWSAKTGSTEAIREIARVHALSEAALNEALAIYNTPDVPRIIPFPDAISTLEALKAAELPLTLVTSGVPDRQLAKIDRLGMRPFFSTNSGNLYLHDPSAEGPSKAPYLRQAAGWMALPHDRIAVVGDKPESEIEAGNRLGMTTILMKAADVVSLPRAPDQTPDFEIDCLGDLTEILL
jgi:FMN phosphatase YigB (HAD superfamily)